MKFSEIISKKGVYMPALLLFILVHSPQAQWRPVWSDEFDRGEGEGVDGSKWRYNQWNPYKVNQERQKYTDRRENVFHDGKGHLVIRGLRDYWNGYEFTSGRIETGGKMEFHHSHRIEVSAILPKGKGSWPAIWFLASSGGWPNGGEIDLVEQWGNNKSNIQCNTHTGGADGDIPEMFYEYKTDSAAYTEFHEYALEWMPNSLKFYVDGEKFGESNFTSGPFTYNNHYLILNVAIGGMMGGDVGGDEAFPMDMTVDYVRIYEYDEDYVVGVTYMNRRGMSAEGIRLLPQGGIAPGIRFFGPRLLLGILIPESQYTDLFTDSRNGKR